jgi:PAN-like domain
MPIPAAPTQPAPILGTPPKAPVATMQAFTGVWVEGPGFDITYGSNYDACSRRCLSTATCVMIEYYRPEKKCNLYSAIRPRLAGGSSVVAIRR